jgi:hypothetical protein
MIPCPSCGHMVSPEAQACPECGHPLRKSGVRLLDEALGGCFGCLGTIFAFLVVLCVFAWLFSSCGC